MRQTLRIARSAQAYKRVKVHLQLFISPAQHPHVTVNMATLDMTLIHHEGIEIQVAPGHVFDGKSDFLIVTNPETRKNQLDALKDLIENQLSMKMDIWNLGLYGGLFRASDLDTDETESVLSQYKGKTIIFLGNKFDFFGYESTSVLQLCDVNSVVETCRNGNRRLFLGSAVDPRDKTRLEDLLFPVLERLPSHLSQLPTSSWLESRKQLLKAVTESEATGGERTFALNIKVTKYLPHLLYQPYLSAAAKRTSNLLHEHFPQDRFWVFPTQAENNRTPDCIGTLLICRGLPRTALTCVTESDLMQSLDRNASTQNLPLGRRLTTKARPTTLILAKYDTYMVLASMPVCRRIDLLWAGPEGHQLSTDVLQLISLSLQADIDREVQGYLSRAPWPNAIDITRTGARAGSSSSLSSSLDSHLPAISALLEHHTSGKLSAQQQPPEEILRLFSFALAASSPQKKRHIIKQAAVPFCHRRAQLHSFLVHAFEDMLSRSSDMDAGEMRRLLNQRQRNNDAVHSLWTASKRRTSTVIAAELAVATGKSTHFLSKACLGIGDICPRTRCWPVAEWDRRLDVSFASQRELNEYCDKAQEEKGKLLIMEESEEDIVEVGEKDPYVNVGS